MGMLLRLRLFSAVAIVLCVVVFAVSLAHGDWAAALVILLGCPLAAYATRTNPRTRWFRNR